MVSGVFQAAGQAHVYAEAGTVPGAGVHHNALWLLGNAGRLRELDTAYALRERHRRWGDEALDRKITDCRLDSACHFSPVQSARLLREFSGCICGGVH